MSRASEDLRTNYTVSISIEKPIATVFAALLDVKSWWMGEISGNANTVGSQFSYRYKEFHFSTQKVVEIAPNHKVVWEVVESKLSFVQNEQEWTGTKLIFELQADGPRTLLQFTHAGLHPSLECYEACSSGWDFYLKKSLLNFVAGGKGVDPNFE